MKPYQDHDEMRDIGKAIPKPRRPTTSTRRVRQHEGDVVLTGEPGRKTKTREAHHAAKVAAHCRKMTGRRNGMFGKVASLMARVGIRVNQSR